MVTIDDVELASYREAHTRAEAPSVDRRVADETSVRAADEAGAVPRPPVAALATDETKRRFDEGQRVSHTAFGVGVTMSSSRGHTIVRFDEDGPRTFVTSMVDSGGAVRAPHVGDRPTREEPAPRHGSP